MQWHYIFTIHTPFKVFSLAAIVHFGLLSSPCMFPGIQIIWRSAYCFFALSSTAGYLLSGLRQPSHPARIFSGILPDPFYLLPARRLRAHVTLVQNCRPNCQATSCTVDGSFSMRRSKHNHFVLKCRTTNEDFWISSVFDNLACFFPGLAVFTF